MKTNKTLIATGFALILATASQTASATIIVDTTGNGSVATALEIDTLFSTSLNLDVYDSINTPWVSIVRDGTQDNDTQDYFSFTANAGDVAHFDFDYSNDFRTALYDDSATPVAINDPFNPSFGFDLNTLDPIAVDNVPFFSPNLLSYTFATTGTYTFGVEGSCGFGCGAQIDPGAGYTLNISVERAPTDVPEPTSLSILALGLLGFAGRKLARKNK